jgi:hypothetical protein
VQWNGIIDSTWNIFALSISLNRLGLHLQFVRYIDERRDNHIYHKYLALRYSYALQMQLNIYVTHLVLRDHIDQAR